MNDALLTDELLEAIEQAVESRGDRDLKAGIPACIAELQYCKSALARLDHLYGRALDDLDETKRTWELVEAEAARAARDDAPSAATATEIRGRIAEYVERRPSARTARESYLSAVTRRDKLERWMRTFEHRLSAAQSAQNGHDRLARYGGGGR